MENSVSPTLKQNLAHFVWCALALAAVSPIWIDAWGFILVLSTFVIAIAIRRIPPLVVVLAVACALVGDSMEESILYQFAVVVPNTLFANALPVPPGNVCILLATKLLLLSGGVFLLSREKVAKLWFYLNLVIFLLSFAVVEFCASFLSVSLNNFGIYLSVYLMLVFAINISFVLREIHLGLDVCFRSFFLLAIVTSVALSSVVLHLINNFGLYRGKGSAKSDKVLIFEPKSSPNTLGDFTSSIWTRGLSSIGLYGDLKFFLSRIGYETVAVDSLCHIAIDSFQLVICPSFGRPLANCETQALGDYVISGGNLIAVAEHTNLDSNSTTINKMFGDYGLRVNFDVTDGLYGEGIRGTITPPSIISASIRGSPFLTYNRGASIEINPFHAIPVLIGEYWFSDYGDSLASNRAFMSDYVLSKGDRLGAVNLIGLAPVGKGKLLLFGDSSPFLNQNLVYNARFLAGICRTMIQVTLLVSPFHQILLEMLIFGFFLAAYYYYRPHNKSLTLMIIILLTTVLTQFVISIIDISPFSNDSFANWVVISSGENNSISRDPFSPNSITALGLVAFREGLVPVLSDWRSIPGRPHAIFIIKPEVALSKSDIEKLKEYSSNGTGVVLAGDGDNVAFVNTAKRLGIDVTDDPLPSLSDSNLSMFTAWRIEDIPNDAEAIRIGEYCVGANLRSDNGKLVLIADGGFFLTRNLESDFGYDIENSIFLRSLLVQMKK